MKTRILYILICVATLFCTSCNDEFLEISPIAQPSSTSFFVNDSNAVAALTAAYHVLRGNETYSIAQWLFGDVRSDDSETGGMKGGNDQPHMQQIDQLTLNSSNEQPLGFWKGMYIGINRCNIVIERIPGNSKISTPVARQVEGEARFLRAMLHFDLCKAFGGVPIIDKVVSSFKPERNTIIEVFSFVENELKKSAELMLPIASQDGRATSVAAKALLVKLLVFESSYAMLPDPNGIYEGCKERWDEVRTIATELIDNSSSFGIGLDPDFGLIWRVAGEHSKEHIFKIKATRLSGHIYPGISFGLSEYDSYGGSGSTMALWQGCNMHYDGKDLVYTYDRAWGFNCPTQQLVDCFSPKDPRLKHTIIHDFVDSIQRMYKGQIAWVPASTDASPTHYSGRKYMVQEDEMSPAELHEHAGTMDIKLIRYADLLLWAAEAELHGGSVSKATQYVNLIRKRARETVNPASPEPADLSTVTLEDIQKERRIELALEGHRFYDLVRWGKTYDFINGQFNSTVGQNLEFLKNTHELLPIPLSEITLSGGSLIQNNGY
jgi:hypothetical protein